MCLEAHVLLKESTDIGSGEESKLNRPNNPEKDEDRLHNRVLKKPKTTAVKGRVFELPNDDLPIYRLI